MSKILEKIQNNAFLGMAQKVVGTMDPIYVLLSIILICASLFSGGNPWSNQTMSLIVIGALPIFCSICVFVISLSVGKMKAGDDISSQSLSIALATLCATSPLLLSSTHAPYALLPAFLCALLIKFVFLLSRDIKLKGTKIPGAVLSTLSGLIPLVFLALFSVSMFSLVARYAQQIVSLTHQLFSIIGSYPVMLLSVLCICLIWTSGYHGANIVNRVMRVFWVPMTLINIVSFTSTGKPVYIGTEGLITTFVWIGGSGGTLGLSIMLKLFTKSDYMQSIANESLVPGLFNINEPVIFGVPIVENKRYYIPFFLAPILMVTLSYFAIQLGYVRFPAYTITWIMPGPLAALFGTFFDWSAMLLAFVNIFVSGLVYLPFILKHDKELRTNNRVLN
ncbi:hypothetical protein AOC36_06060 [Erysipelothrix larvae]|uniref:Permease IIC component n=1 Tax=Erysipelothrix larvae TaxID=1514105 RepID=A0A0X8H014_9FIRM|nr:PTS transporter subunit EIIC [Erysipelothrix larvae]AMC93562.1 hypothetical protein AOC36_06060 [Erysipelothrix larvae]